MKKPGIVASLARLSIGSFVALMGLVMMVLSGWEGLGPSLFFAFILCFGIRWLLLGALGLARPLPPRKVTYGVAVAAVVVLGALGTTISGAYQRSHEPEAWSQVSSSKDPEVWRKQYKNEVGAPYRRGEYLSRECEALCDQALRKQDFSALRVQADLAFVKNPSAYDDQARQAISAAWQQIQAEGLKKVKPTQLADPKMTAAFKEVLGALAAKPSRQVLLHFEAAGTLDKHARDKQFFGRLEPKYRNLPVLPVGDAFSAEAHARRGGAVRAALQGSFDSVWPKGMVEVKAAGKDPTPDDVHFWVQAQVRRLPGFYTNSEGGKITSLLYKCEVAWRFRVVVEGRDVGSFEFRSEPAKHVAYSTKSTDPEWAPYSIVMDSATDNFARLIVGRLGLQPPPARESYTFTK